MKQVLRSALLIAGLFFTLSSYAQTPEEIEELQLNCAVYWNDLDATLMALGLNRSYFTMIDGVRIRDICNIDNNDTYPFDERISIRVYNHYYPRMARQEFADEKAAAEDIDGYMTIPDLGDEAFAISKIQFGRLDAVIIEVLKGNVTIHFDIKGNYANDTNNRFTPASIFNFARAIVEPIPTND